MLRVRKHDDDSTSVRSTSICSDSVRAVHPYHRPRKRRRTIVDALQSISLVESSSTSSPLPNNNVGSRHGTNRNNKPDSPNNLLLYIDGDNQSTTSGVPEQCIVSSNRLADDDYDNHSLLSEDETAAPGVDDITFVLESCDDYQHHHPPNQQDADEVRLANQLSESEKAQRQVMLELVFGKSPPYTSTSTTTSNDHNKPQPQFVPTLKSPPPYSITSSSSNKKKSPPKNSPSTTTTTTKTSSNHNNNNTTTNNYSNPVDAKIENMIRDSLQRAVAGKHPIPSSAQDDMYLETSIYNRCRSESMESAGTSGGDVSGTNDHPTDVPMGRPRSNSLPMEMEEYSPSSYNNNMTTTTATITTTTTDDEGATKPAAAVKMDLEDFTLA